MKIDRNTLFVLVVGLAAGWWLFSSPDKPSPIVPNSNRPVLSFLAKAARTALWVMVFAEGPPASASEPSMAHDHGGVGRDGFATVNHGRGW